jgi:hypothetical protein
MTSNKLHLHSGSCRWRRGFALALVLSQERVQPLAAFSSVRNVGKRRMPMSSLPAITSTAFLSRTALVALLPTTTQIFQTTSVESQPENDNIMSKLTNLPPRAKSVVYMAIAMALHFGGYEFIRNSCLSLFTSSDYGFTNPAAFPFAYGIVSPFSIVLLLAYGRQLEAVGPRGALFRSTAASIAFIGLAVSSLWACRYFQLPRIFGQAIIAVTFLFQNSYQYLLYTQQWSFVSSVLTPKEGARWIMIIAGVSSLLCAAMGTLVPLLLPRTGLLGLMATTMITLTGTLFFSDAAYRLSQEHGFYPGNHKKEPKQSSKQQPSNRFVKAIQLFRRVPTLGALFAETISFQTLNTVLSVAFFTALNAQIPNDIARSAYTSRV